MLLTGENLSIRRNSSSGSILSTKNPMWTRKTLQLQVKDILPTTAVRPEAIQILEQIIHLLKLSD
jgi:hypothetical protein